MLMKKLLIIAMLAFGMNVIAQNTKVHIVINYENEWNDNPFYIPSSTETSGSTDVIFITPPSTYIESGYYYTGTSLDSGTLIKLVHPESVNEYHTVDIIPITTPMDQTDSLTNYYINKVIQPTPNK